MSNFIDFVGGGSGSVIKSIQRGFVSMATGTSESRKVLNTTISAVDITKSVVNFNGVSTSISSTADNDATTSASGQCRLTSATNVESSIASQVGIIGFTLYFAWEVIEYE